MSVAGDPLHLEGQDEYAFFLQATGVRTLLTTPSLNLHYVRAPRTLGRTMGFYFRGQEGVGGSSPIFTKPAGSPGPAAFSPLVTFVSCA